jgi:hypothetical protein
MQVMAFAPPERIGPVVTLTAAILQAPRLAPEPAVAPSFIDGVVSGRRLVDSDGLYLRNSTLLI